MDTEKEARYREWVEITLVILEIMGGRHKQQVVSECVKRGYRRRDAADTFKSVCEYVASIWDHKTDIEACYYYEDLAGLAGDPVAQFEALLEWTQDDLFHRELDEEEAVDDSKQTNSLAPEAEAEPACSQCGASMGYNDKFCSACGQIR